MPRAKPIAGVARPAERLDQAVVAAAAADGVLRRLERRGRVLERGAGVVVEAPHQAGVDAVGHAERLEAGLHPVEVGLAGVAEWSSWRGARR